MLMASNNSNDAVLRQPSMISHEEEVVTQQYQVRNCAKCGRKE